jgi:hypothetical protein
MQVYLNIPKEELIISSRIKWFIKFNMPDKQVWYNSI